MADAAFPEPFVQGLEFNPPARGPWNIVHMGLMLPETHAVYVCARGCLRGVVLTAAEMEAMDRMSWVSIDEEDICTGRLEQNMTEGVTDVLNRLPYTPRAVLVYCSCVHVFTGFNFDPVMEELSRRFPAVRFVACRMAPTMRRTVTEEETTRCQMYSLLEPPACGAFDPSSVSIIGNDRPTDAASELVRLIAGSGRTLHDLTLCRNFDEFLAMGSSFLCIATHPGAVNASRTLCGRTGQRFLCLPVSYRTDRILAHLQALADALGCAVPDTGREQEEAEKSLQHALQCIGEAPLAVDFTATPAPLGLARLLAEHGFRVASVYADAFDPAEKEDFLWLSRHVPDLVIRSIVHPSQRFAGLRKAQGQEGSAEKGVLAVGQKAAFLSGTRHFVNMVAAGGFWGFTGIARTAQALEEAWRNEKDTMKVISYKGLGCRSCL